MKITVSSKFDKKTAKALRAAASAANAHAPMVGITHLKIVHLSKKHRKTVDGMAGLTSRNTAKIEISHNRPIEALLDTVFHESFHIHQMSKDYLRQEPNGFTWHGFFIPYWLYQIAYNFMPFERQAVAFAKRMIARLREL